MTTLTRGTAVAQRRRPHPLPLAGAVWSGGFAVAHVYWAAGGRVGLPAGAAAIGTRPAFLAYDLASAAVFAGAALVAIALGLELGSRGLQHWLVWLTAFGAVVAVVRGAIGGAQDLLAALSQQPVPTGAIYDLWFAVAGVLFLVVVHRQRPT